MSLALQNSLTSSNIKAGFRGVGIWPLNFKAMKEKMDPSEQFVFSSAAEVVIEEEMNQKIMEEGISSPSPNSIHYYVNSMEDEDALHDDEDVKKPSTQDNISRFLNLPQEVIIPRKTRAKPLIDYSQSHILTSVEHVETLHSIANKGPI